MNANNANPLDAANAILSASPYNARTAISTAGSSSRSAKSDFLSLSINCFEICQLIQPNPRRRVPDDILTSSVASAPRVSGNLDISTFCTMAEVTVTP